MKASLLRNILKHVQNHEHNGILPSSAEGQLIALDVDILTKKSFGEHPELIEKFWEARKSEETSAQLGLYPIHKEVLYFLEEAIVYQSTL